MQGLGNTSAIKPSIREVQEIVCAGKRLHISAMKSKSRQRRIAYPRQVAMALAREFCGKSYPQLGLHFGGRDHTTVLFAVRKIALRASQNCELEIALNRYREQIAELIEAKAAKAFGSSSAWTPPPPVLPAPRTAREAHDAKAWFAMGGERVAA